ncbi:MAG: hypothetical protein KME17_19180 [Cyanosarcina radialis HA8281-LM2]|jgi:hypothetical protein|nr:hypothetical protein [Cyanosarcina radialis HA8281-LM2]
MSQRIIESFWNLPGFVGIAIITKIEEELYFYVKPQVQDWEKPALTQLMSQSIAKTHPKIKYFEFDVMGYHAFTLRISPTLKFIILTQTDAVKLPSLNILKELLEEDLQSSIANFDALAKKSIAGSGTSQSLLTNRPAAKPTAIPTQTVKEPGERVTVSDLVNILDRVTKVASKYIGKKLTASYLESNRPSDEWLRNFQIKESGEIAFAAKTAEPVSSDRLNSFKSWLVAFIKQAARIFPYLPTVIDQEGLNERQKNILK